MIKTSRDLLDFLGLKEGDRIKVDNRLYDVKYLCDDYRLVEVHDYTHVIAMNTPTILINKEYEIVKESILNDKEREYLSNVIKPFRDKVQCIKKTTCRITPESYISIELCYDDGEYDEVSLPNFDTCSMYTGMELDKEYTLEELGL